MSKLQDKPFSQRAKTIGVFNTEKQIREENPKIEPREVKERPINKAEHDKPFRPSHPPRVGHNKTIGAFPAWEKEPPKDIV